MSLPTMTTLHGLSFPQGITTVGVEFEGYWERDESIPPPHNLDDCDVCTWDPDYNEYNYCEAYYHEEDEEETERDARRRLDLKFDGSVWCDEWIPHEEYIAGEVASPILESWDAVMEFTADRLPDTVDYKTGMHIHMGITRALLEFSYSPKYWDHLRHTLTQVGASCSPQTQAWMDARLATGKSSEEGSSYCMPNTMENRGERYCMANYTAFDAHGTLEIRVCPMALGARPASRERQTLAMIYGVLQATSDYWTSRALWQQAAGYINAPEQLTLLTSELTPAPPITRTITV